MGIIYLGVNIMNTIYDDKKLTYKQVNNNIDLCLVDIEQYKFDMLNNTTNEQKIEDFKEEIRLIFKVKLNLLMEVDILND